MCISTGLCVRLGIKLLAGLISLGLGRLWPFWKSLCPVLRSLKDARDLVMDFEEEGMDFRSIMDRIKVDLPTTHHILPNVARNKCTDIWKTYR